MARQNDPFVDNMQDGDLSLRKGDLDSAYNSYDEALEESIEEDEIAVASQHLGIVCRIRGDYDEAGDHLRVALRHSVDNPLLTAFIQNDYALNYMEYADTVKHGPVAEGLFGRAKHLLDEAHATFEKHKLASGIAINEGFLARLQLFQRQPKVAQHLFHSADVKLKAGGNRDHELDNLMWYIGIADAKVRPELVKRAHALIAITGQDRRTKQLKLVQLGINPITLLHAKRYVKRILRK